MTVRVVQAGKGPRRPLVVGFLLGSSLDPQFRALFGPTPCMVAWEAFGAPEPGSALIAEYTAAAKAAGWDGAGDVYLVGWSLGCTRIRSVLPALKAAGKVPAAVVCLDGTTASWPTPAPGQRDVWQELVRGARAGELTAVLTCTSMGYTERLASPETPYWATLHMLRDVTGWAMAVAATPDSPEAGVTEYGKLHVVRFASSDCDAQAHRDQQNKVLFWAVRTWILPLLDAAAPTDPAPAPEAPRTALDVALAELAAAVREDPPGSNRGPRVDEYLRPTGLQGVAWCAAFACWCSREAGEAFCYVPSVAQLWRWAVGAGRARPADAEPRPGWLAIFARTAGQDPRTGGEGHVGRLICLGPAGSVPTVDTVDGNHGDRVARVLRARSEVLGWIVDGEEDDAVIDDATAGRLWALADALDRGDAEGAALDRIERG